VEDQAAEGRGQHSLPWCSSREQVCDHYSWKGGANPRYIMGSQICNSSNATRHHCRILDWGGMEAYHHETGRERGRAGRSWPASQRFSEGGRPQPRDVAREVTKLRSGQHHWAAPRKPWGSIQIVKTDQQNLDVEVRPIVAKDPIPLARIHLSQTRIKGKATGDSEENCHG